MNKANRILTAMPALALALSLLCMPAAAATAAPTTAPTAAPTATAAPSASASASASPAPTATQAPSGSVYVQASTVTDAAGGELTTIKWNDTFNVVLRVLDHSSAVNNVKAEDIVARVNSSVFQYTGTGEISQLFQGEDANGPYYTYVLLFRDVKYIGGGNSFPVDLSYQNSSMEQQHFSVTLGQCLDKDPSDTSKVKSPALLLRESSYGNVPVTAGNPFTLSLTVYATGGGEDINDVVVSVTLPEHITLTGGSLSSYVGAIGSRSSREVSFQILPDSGITATVANVTVNMAGVGALTGNAVTATSTISVPVSQPDRFEAQNLQVPDDMTVGQSATVSLGFVNKGKNPISNLEASISGANFTTDASQQYIGNIAAGSENSVDFELIPTAGGMVSGTITLTYEGTSGAPKKITKEFSANAQEAAPMDTGDTGMAEPEPTKAGMPVWGWVVMAGAAAAAAAIAVAAVRKKKKAAALNNLEDSDEDL